MEFDLNVVREQTLTNTKFSILHSSSTDLVTIYHVGVFSVLIFCKCSW